MEVHVRMQGIREAFELSALCATCGRDSEVIEMLRDCDLRKI